MWSGWVQGNANGPLVPMVRLVPVEKHPIPMVLLLNMHPLRGLRLFSRVVWLGTGQFQWSIGTNGTIGTNRKAPYSNGSIAEDASH